MDNIVLLSAAGGFVVYLAVHFAVFRHISAQEILKWLMNVFYLGALADAVICSMWLWKGTSLLATLGVLGVAFGVAVSLAIYTLVCFFYVFYVFGIFESSIRIRILRELDDAPSGLMLSELLKRYNARKILETRLKRFIGSGELVFSDGKYRMGKPSHIFYGLDALAKIFKKIIFQSSSDT